MRKILIVFSGAAYDETTKLIVERAPTMGADEVWVYDDKWLLEQDFLRLPSNRWLLDHPQKRGFYWYCWKPFIIMDALSKVADGDIIFYNDADSVPIADFSVLFDICNREDGIMLFAAQGHRHYKWCKKDCYVVMAQNEEKYFDVPAGVARFMLFQKGHWRTTQFMAEWLTYTLNPLANTFDPSVLAIEGAGFIEHRCEQAILTNLAHRYGLSLHRECDDAGEYQTPTMQHLDDRSFYDQLFLQINPHKEKYTHEVGNGSAYRNING